MSVFDDTRGVWIVEVHEGERPLMRPLLGQLPQPFDEQPLRAGRFR